MTEEMRQENTTLIKNYLNSKKKGKGNTRKNYEIDLRQFSEFVYAEYNGKSLLEVTVDEVNDYFNNYLEDKSSSTKNRKISSIRGFYEYYIYTDRYLKKNPTGLLDNFTIDDQKEVKALTYEESKGLMQTIKTEIKKSKTELQKNLAIRNLAFVNLLLTCGLRIDEAMTLLLADIDIFNKTIFIRGSITKNSKSRKLPLYDNTIKYLINYLEIRDTFNPEDNYVFVSKNGNKLDETSIDTMLKKYGSQCGLEGLFAHQLRHTFGSDFYSQTKDIIALKEALGHSSVSTTQIYVDLFEKEIEDKIVKIKASRL